MKNKIKSILLILLAVAMMFILTGCGDKEESDSKKKENESNQTQVEDNTEKVDLGKWSNNIYTNNNLGMKITLPEGWTPASDEKMAEFMHIGEEVLADEGKYISEVAKQTSIYYASATEDKTGNGIIVMSEKATGLTVDGYIDALKTQLTSVTQMSYKVVDEGTAELAGKTWKTLTLSESVYGVTQRYYVCEKDDAFLGIILTSISGEDTLNQIEEFFK